MAKYFLVGGGVTIAMVVLLWLCSSEYRTTRRLETSITSTRNSVGKVGPSSLYPDPRLTPGLINPEIRQENIDETICSAGWTTSSIRPTTAYTQRLKRLQLQLQQVSGNLHEFEEDHLISLELGGHPTDPRNLWPERYAPRPGAREKDVVENYLHREVCKGRISLADAQNEIASDWYAVYLRIQTSRP
jgi:hypothetical protein